MDPNRLRSIKLFQPLSDEDIMKVAPFANETSVAEGHHLVDEGDFSWEFMGIEEGKADVLREGEHVAELGPGDFFGETGLLEKERRNATVVAKTPMRLITLTQWDLKRIDKEIPDAAEQIRRAIAERKPASEE